MVFHTLPPGYFYYPLIFDRIVIIYSHHVFVFIVYLSTPASDDVNVISYPNIFWPGIPPLIVYSIDKIKNAIVVKITFHG